MEKSEQINELALALNKAQKEIESAKKTSDNPFFHSKYADLASVYEACKEALNKNGLSVIQTLGYDEKHSYLMTTLVHSSGQWIAGKMVLLNNKGDMQGLGSAVTYARRYSLAAMVGVAQEDDDANEASQPKPNINNIAGDIKSTVEKISTVEKTSKPSGNFGKSIIKFGKYSKRTLESLNDSELFEYAGTLAKSKNEEYKNKVWDYYSAKYGGLKTSPPYDMTTEEQKDFTSPIDTLISAYKTGK